IHYDTENLELDLDNIYDYSSNEGLFQTLEIAKKCNLEWETGELLLPIYETKDGCTSHEYLVSLSQTGLSRRLKNKVPKAYQERLTYELDIIEKMGFSNYFLVVYDFIKYAKKNHILVGPGRGSGAGSLVCYSIGITDLDPIHYDLLFERFLNPERISMPDIDTDFPDVYRDQVIRYVTEKYGEKKVSGIVTFGTLAAKQAIRDVSRVLNIPSYQVDQISKRIPSFTKQKLKDFYTKDSEFKQLIDMDEKLKLMLKISMVIEGFPRHTSSHAAGIVMCKKDLDEVIPLTKNDGIYLTGFPMEYLEELGLLKMDFLGLKTLTTIMNILKDIEVGENKTIDFQTIPL
ncbi:MAG: DNA polymerase III subunit alpha, partial [Bacilli bacterium]|nr:DNA polymerase III subunit alpha [Bacilli bacterium]